MFIFKYTSTKNPMDFYMLEVGEDRKITTFNYRQNDSMNQERHKFSSTDQVNAFVEAAEKALVELDYTMDWSVSF